MIKVGSLVKIKDKQGVGNVVGRVVGLVGSQALIRLPCGTEQCVRVDRLRMLKPAACNTRLPSSRIRLQPSHTHFDVTMLPGGVILGYKIPYKAIRN